MVLRTVPIPRDPITIMSAPSSSAALMIPSPGSTHCTLRTIPEACKSRYIQSIMFYTSCFILLFNNYYWLEKDCFTSPDFEEEQAYGGRQENLKCHNWSLLTNSRRRYMAEILLNIRRKTFIQSIFLGRKWT